MSKYCHLEDTVMFLRYGWNRCSIPILQPGVKQ